MKALKIGIVALIIMFFWIQLISSDYGLAVGTKHR